MTIEQEDFSWYPLGDDIGFVNVVDSMGNDLTVVNSARVSYGAYREELEEKDKKLIEYLAKHKHTSPFRHCFITFHVKCPLFVRNQWYKHIVGSNYSMGDHGSHGWNEISGRYVDIKPEFYIPYALRKQHESSKQASVETEQELFSAELDLLEDTTFTAYENYQELIEKGVAKEQARMILPQNMYTEFYWTASLHAIAHFASLRDKPDAQFEIQAYAKAIAEEAKFLFPNSFEILKENL
jgi:thymidylate synthase (FAD)